MTDERYEELHDWDIAYRGELMQLTRAELLDHLRYDATEFENANYHAEAQTFGQLVEAVEALPADAPLGWFAWSVSDLGPLRRCLVSV